MRVFPNFVSLLVGAFVISLVFLLETISPLHAFATTVPTPTTHDITNVSDSPNTISAFPVVIQGSLFTTYIAWVEYDNSGDGSSLYMATITGNNFGQPVKITDESGKNSEPMLAFAESGGVFHFIFTNKDKRMEAIDATVSDSGAHILNKTFLSPEKVTETVYDANGQPQQSELEVRGFDPAIIADKNGIIHAVWIDDRDGVTDAKYRVFHRRLINGSWEADDREIAPHGSLQKRTAITVTNDNIVHVAMNADGHMIYASFDGNTWKSETPPTSGTFNLVSLGASGNTVHAVWSNNQNGHSIFYANNTGNGWTTPIQLDTDETFDDFPSVVVSQYGGPVYALWSSGPDEHNDNPVTRTINSDGTLGDPQIVATDARSNWVRGVQAGLSTYVIWQSNASIS